MNKKQSGPILIGLLALLSTLAYVGCNSQEDASVETEIQTTDVLGVNDAVLDLKPDTTVKTVIGVVRTVSPDDNLLTLIDVEEYKACGLSDCCLYMPVRWQGEMPGVEEIVTVQGSIDSTEAGMVFSAGELQINGAAVTQ